MRVRTAIFLLLLMPLVRAEWVVTVETDPFYTDFVGYADSNGCIYVISGVPRAFTYYSAAGADRYENVGEYLCLPAGTFFSLSLSGTDIYVRFPEANVIVESTLLMDVYSRKLGEATFVSARLSVAQLFLISLFLAVLLALILSRRSRRPQISSTEDAVVEYVAEHPGCSQKEIAKALGLEKYQVTRILGKLEQRGIIVRIRHGISKRVYLKKQLQ